MKKFALLIAVLLLFTLFYGLGSHGLIDPDEGRYAEIPREMLETGDFITPRLNYVKYFEKPVLHYWLTAASFAAFGQNEFAARLVPALCSLLGVCVVFALARRQWNAAAGVYSAVILSTGLLWFAVGRFNITDMTVSFFITISAAGYWLACGDGNSDNVDNKKYLLLFYAGMALATLSKGLIGIVLPGGIAFWHIVFTRRWRLIARALYWPGVVLFLMLSVPWYWAVCSVNEDFFHFFFIQEHFLRYATTIHDHYEPFWFFIPVLIAGSIPWAGLLPDIFRTLWKLINRNEEQTTRSFGIFLGLWFAVPFIFFSLSGSKLVPYIVPCLPPLAILGGRVLQSITEGDGAAARRFLFLSSIVWVILTMGGLIYAASLPDKKIAADIFRCAARPLGALLCFVCAGLCAYRARAYTVMVRCVCVLAFVSTAFFAGGFELAADRKSYRETAAVIRAQAGPDDVVACFKDTGQGLGFYLGRRIVLVSELNELEFGARQEQDPFWFIGTDALLDLWKGGRRVFLTADVRHANELASLLGKSIIEVGRTQYDVVFSNFAK